jgi:glutaconyl-CoA/methylmalonyl-CoA decarboxylase subunit gamma
MKKYKLEINQKEYDTRIVDYSASRVIVKVNGQDFEVKIIPEERTITKIVRSEKKSPSLDVISNPSKKIAASAGTVISPIPGLVLSVKIAIGDNVKIGDTVIILEAMKMESEIESTAAGTVKKILVKEQQSIQEGDPIIVVE